MHRAIEDVEREMLEAAEALEFERAAVLRDQLLELKRGIAPGEAPNGGGSQDADRPTGRPTGKSGRRGKGLYA